jgi:hypothetical protein
VDDAINIQFSEFVYTSKEVCTSVGIASSTLRTWCLRLEAAGYIFRREKQGNDGNGDGSRVFFERDITALRMMKDLLDKKHPMDYVVEQISSKYKAMTAPVIVGDGDASVKAPVIDNAFISVIRASLMEELKSEVAATVATAIQDSRQRRITDRITERRIEMRLEEEALKLWAEQPATERFRKKGWFSKEEDSDKKGLFIRNYIQEHLEERLKEAYGVDEPAEVNSKLGHSELKAPE